MLNLLLFSFLISIIIYFIYNFLTSYFIYIWIICFTILLYFYSDKIKENFSSRVPNSSLIIKKKINCKKNSTCKISENNYNSLPFDIRNLGKTTSKYFKNNN